MTLVLGASRPERLCSKSGRDFLVRPATPGDMNALAAMMLGLSPATLERRYLAPRLLQEDGALREARRLTRPESAGMVLVAQTPGAAGRIVGVAELAPDRAEPEVAEGAVVVADPYQGDGIGRALMQRLGRVAAGTPIRRVRAITGAYNTPMRRLIASLGRPYTARFAGAEVQYEVAL